jgi:DNA-binding XRE family transcriptional regulator
MKLSELILLSRKRAARMTQTGLAKKLNTNRATVSCWETGIRTPNLQNFAELRRCFNWSDTTVIEVLQGMGSSNEST